MAALAGLFLEIVAGIEEENFPHLGFREFLELRSVASFADLSADIGGLLRRLSLCRPQGYAKDEKESQK